MRPKPALSREVPAAAGAAAASRTAWFDGKAVATPIFRGEQLSAGARVEGLAVIKEPTTTIVLIPNSRALVRETHYLIALDC